MNYPYSFFQSSTLLTPFNLTILFFEDCPETISTSFLVIPNPFASTSMSSLFAFPSTGGEVSLTFSEFPYGPTIPDFDERSSTLILSVNSFCAFCFFTFSHTRRNFRPHRFALRGKSKKWGVRQVQLLNLSKQTPSPSLFY